MTKYVYTFGGKTADRMPNPQSTSPLRECKGIPNRAALKSRMWNPTTLGKLRLSFPRRTQKCEKAHIRLQVLTVDCYSDICKYTAHLPRAEPTSALKTK